MFDLKSQLIACCAAWSEAHGCGISRIAKQVAGDANFFVRLGSPAATCNVATLEKFARFLGDPAKWPDGVVPPEVIAFAHVTGVTAPATPVATGQIGELSGERAA